MEVGCSNRRIMVEVQAESMVGGTAKQQQRQNLPLKGDSSQGCFPVSSVVSYHGPSQRCLRIARDSFRLTRPSLLSMGDPRVTHGSRKGHPSVTQGRPKGGIA